MGGMGEGAIGQAAAAQRGLVHRSQLHAAGIDRHAVGRLVKRGSLYPILPRVYAVGHPNLAPGASELAVLLWLGHDAVISHESAAWLWGLDPSPPSVVQATLIGRDARRRPGLEVHRVAGLERGDIRLKDGIAVTSPARTLIDLAAVRSDTVLARALAQARVLRLISDRELRAAIARNPLRSGVARLRALLGTETGSGLTRSEAERALLRLIAGAQLPRPELNARLNGYEVDFLWRAARLVVEVDGHRFHAHHGAFETDRRRDQVHAAAGYIAVRVTWRQLREEPLATIARIAQALALAGAGAESTTGPGSGSL
jgi:very-short-patch-repair endonuclease